MNWTSSWTFVQRRPWLTSTIGMVCKWSHLPEIQQRLIATELTDVNRLTEEFYPIVPSSPSGKDGRRARLERKKTHTPPQLPAQYLADPAPAEGTATTVLRPGESHRVYYSHDILGSVPENYALVVERAAHWCGVGDEVIYAVVERFERRFQRWKGKDKAEKDPVGSELELEDSEETEE